MQPVHWVGVVERRHAVDTGWRHASLRSSGQSDLARPWMVHLAGSSSRVLVLVGLAASRAQQRGQLESSSALGTLQPPGIGGVPVDAVVGQLGWREGPPQRAAPVVAEHLQQVLPPAQVVEAALARVVLVRGLAVQHQVGVVDGEHGGEEGGGEVRAPEEDVELHPGGVVGDEGNQREDELGDGGPGDLVQVHGQEAGVEPGAVAHREPHVQQEQDEVPGKQDRVDTCANRGSISNVSPVVPVTHAVSHEHAVVLPLEHADAADRAVPGPGRLHGLAAGAELPLLADDGGQDDVARARVGQPQPDKVAHNVEEEEGAEGDVGRAPH